MISKEKSSVVTNNNDSPARKKTSAIFSSLPLFLIDPLIDKKERIQAAIKSVMAIVVNSSIIVLPEMFSSLRDVSTTKQRPSKLEEAFNICGDLSLLFSIVIILWGIAFYFSIANQKLL
jgi:hypothetical protein